MLLIYNLIQITAGLLLLPVLLPLVLFTPKYRWVTLQRLGLRLKKISAGPDRRQPVIWVHALSVGEVSSSRALVRRLRREYPHGELLFSASTRSGREYAERVLADDVDRIIPFPLDFLLSVEAFLRTFEPDLFVLVETDLWPNLLAGLRRHQVKAVLVNGRVSEQSFRSYKRFAWFFAPLFNSFSSLAMQAGADVARMKELGVGDERLRCLGNLKYGILDEPADIGKTCENLPPEINEDHRIWVAGSTHRGEEEIVLRAYKKLLDAYPDLYLILAPRNIERADEVADLAGQEGLVPARRSEGKTGGDLLLLDTLGELAGLYEYCEFAFIGGSLVEERGHNPLEAAVFARPVIFGPHMEDFSEIADDLVSCGGAVSVADESAMVGVLGGWLADPRLKVQAGTGGARLVAERSGTTEKHLALIQKLLAERNADED
ncbi:MAG: glycosyltransferase N-terminal domain-containing protein [Thermodesulfobacteriota bacterium]